MSLCVLFLLALLVQGVVAIMYSLQGIAYLHNGVNVIHNVCSCMWTRKGGCLQLDHTVNGTCTCTLTHKHVHVEMKHKKAHRIYGITVYGRIYV